MATLSNAARKQLQRVDDPDGMLLLVLIDHASFAGGIRVVQDTRDWTIGGTSFIGLPLAIKLPQDVSKEATRAQLSIDNVGRDLLAEVEGLPPGASLDVMLRLVSRAAPEVTEWEYMAGASVAEVDVETITLTLGDDELLRRNAVALRYDPSTAPGIFAG
jgi:hypothetical protein